MTRPGWPKELPWEVSKREIIQRVKAAGHTIAHDKKGEVIEVDPPPPDDIHTSIYCTKCLEFWCIHCRNESVEPCTGRDIQEEVYDVCQRGPGDK